MRKSLLLLIIGWLKWMAPALGAAPATRPVTPVDGREILAFNSGQTPIEPPDTLAPPDSRYSSGSFSSKKIFFEKKKNKASTHRLWRQKDGTGKTDALAVLSFVLGVLTITNPYTALPFGIAAIVLGIIALNRIEQTGKKGKGWALSGITLGALFLLFWLIMLMLMVLLVGFYLWHIFLFF